MKAPRTLPLPVSCVADKATGLLQEGEAGTNVENPYLLPPRPRPGRVTFTVPQCPVHRMPSRGKSSLRLRSAAQTRGRAM